MVQLPDTRTSQGRRELRAQLLEDHHDFIVALPKVELHVHIEGTLTPELRWKLARRNGSNLHMGNRSSQEAQSVEALRQAYDSVISSAQLPDYEGHQEVPPTFFQAYYSGCDVLQTRQDFADLAFDYFQRAASMNVRYCEVFFDPQSHTARGVSWEDLMGGLRDAQQKAAAELNVCFTHPTQKLVYSMMKTDTYLFRSGLAGSCASFATRPWRKPCSTTMPPHHTKT